MNHLGGIASKFTGNKNENQNQGNDKQNSGGDNQQEDYLDKGIDSVENKYGQGKVDPGKMRDTNEKISDTARGGFEKTTGHKVPEKFSN